MKPLKFACTVASCTGFLAILVAIFAAPHDGKRWLGLFVVGIAFGFALAPEIEPKRYKKPYIYQVGGCGIAGIAIGCMNESKVENILFLGIIGCAIGWLAPYWFRYL